MEARAIRKHIRSSPRKMRVIANLVRGKRVPEALNMLDFMAQKATRPVEVTIRSALANWREKYREERLDEAQLVVTEIRIDDGARLKRSQAVSRGRAHPVVKRSSHVTVVVSTPVSSGSAKA